ncbi:unnamed protein product [Cuscuta epithymum]|uniref:Pentatricopeptide repeat-containing protein n=1 Tax=Cuscuta epithymum TaxID=186058 RepID=A0AAV0GGZ5_9ASTE|nr:unnamed protein product [Cuscuta epithymum]
MKKAISLASITTKFLKIKFLFFSGPRFQCSFSTENCLYHVENIKHSGLIELLQEPLTWVQIHSLGVTKSLHALIIKIGFTLEQVIFPLNNVLSKYVLYGDVNEARGLFDEMTHKNAVSYNTMITAYSQYGNVSEAWKLFSEIRRCGFDPTQFTFGGLLSCKFLNYHQVAQLHALIEKTPLFHTNAFVGTSLLTTLGKCGCIHEAWQIFKSMPRKNLVTWNSMIVLFGQHGYVENSMKMFIEILRDGRGLSEATFVGLLSCFVELSDVELGEQVHGVALKYGLDIAISVKNSLVNMYAKCFCAQTSNKMFEEVPVKDTISWNIIIGAMANSDSPDKALSAFVEMYANGFSANEITFINVLNSCTRLKSISDGEALHAQLFKKRLEIDVRVGSAVLSFYVKCDKLEDAHRCFNDICEKSIVSWNTLMLGYSNRGSPDSFLLMREMIRRGCYPNDFSFSIVMKSSRIAELVQLHSLMIKTGYLEYSYVLSSLMCGYAKNGLLSDALNSKAFNGTPFDVVSTNVMAGIYNRSRQYDKTMELFSALEDPPDMISWNILIAACSRIGYHKEVFDLFRHMQRTGVIPDNYTYVSLFSSCTALCNLGLGSSLHSLLIKNDSNSCDTFVCNVMINMYAKCGSLDSSIKIFNGITKSNVISWTAIISSLGLHGYAYQAIEKFDEMIMNGFKPDAVAFTAVLSACRHAGLVEQGMSLFKEMNSKYGVEPEMDHYVIAVDLLARCGRLVEAEELIDKMPFPPNALIWRTFLDGCKRKRAILIS